jgi:hypothetical protein
MTGAPRAGIIRRLTAAGGNHLVIVRYNRRHDVGDEWVYNAADIDRAPIVWAREMDPTSNRELFQYYGDRKVWLVEPDKQPVAVSPYSLSGQVTAGGR